VTAALQSSWKTISAALQFVMMMMMMGKRVERDVVFIGY
jgi:hypothetical protein